jgi:hypothetical protein
MVVFVTQGFKTFCGLPSIQRPIDGTHFIISKPDGIFCENYFYHKSRGYIVVYKIVVDDQKQFTNIFVGLLGSVNDSRVLRKSAIYYFVQS